MAQRTYAQLVSDIATYLASNSQITASEHRTLEQNIVDTLFASGNGSGGRPYKVYTAILSQTGTSAPTATVLENTLDGTVVWSYSDVGVYVGTLTGAFTSSKTWLQINSTVSVRQFTTVRRSSNDAVEITILDETGNGVNSFLSDTPIEIRVYP